MTDQPNPAPGSSEPGANAPTPPPPPLAPLVGQAAGTEPPADDAPSGSAPPPGWAAPEQPAPAMPAAPAAAPTATRSDKVRMFLIIGGIVAFLAVVLFATMNNASADDLAVGQCFDEPNQTQDITTVVKHECTEPHDAEVFHVTQLTGDSYPTGDAVESFVDANCMPVFATYVGEAWEDNTTYNVGWFYPDSEGWEANRRTLTCYIVNVDGTQLTKSVKVAS